MTTGYILVDTPNPSTAQGTFPRRGGAQLSGTCIVHTSEGNWQSGVDSLTNLVRTRADYGCYHRACDWEDIALYYPWEWETWQDTETNNWAAGISAACKTTDWATMPADIREGYYRNLGIMAADFVTYMASKGVAVPLRRISGAEARRRVPGFAAHGDSGVARTDPGADFDWSKFFAYTAQALTGGGLTLQGSTITLQSATQSTTTQAEDDDMFSDTDRADLARAKQLLESFQTVLTDPVSGVIKQAAELTLKGGVGSRYVRSEVTGEDTVYERADGGKLRPIGLTEFQVAMKSGETYRLVPKWMIDGMPKVA